MSEQKKEVINEEEIEKVAGGVIKPTKNVFKMRIAWGAYSDIDGSFLGDFKNKSDAARCIKDYDESKRTDAFVKENRNKFNF